MATRRNSTDCSIADPLAGLLAGVLMAGALTACGGGSGSSGTTATAASAADTTIIDEAGPAVDITNAIFDERSADCADYDNVYNADVLDIQRSLAFNADVLIAAGTDSCTLVSNNIPNHDFNDATARFATNVGEVGQSFTILRNPAPAATPTALSQRTYNGVMLNGVPIDLLSAGCYDPSSPMADADGNTPIGCNENDPWLLEPLGTEGGFGVDIHNAHVQPDGSYHYHGDPNAMWDDFPGPNGSPVIGFAADGYPIYGSYFYDESTGALRKALSGYALKSGARPSGPNDPGGAYDGTYVADWEYTGGGDLDTCNGMSVDGQYGYYVTDSYPWIIGCLTGTPDDSFNKN